MTTRHGWGRALLGAWLAGCALATMPIRAWTAEPALTVRQGPARPSFRRATVFVASPQGEVEVAVEVAETNPQRMHGLMFVEQMAPGQGMIFLFDRTEEHGFWMKNTLIPLDMLFLDDQRRVVGIHEHAVPLALDHITVGKASRYVLEVNAGWARRKGIKTGAQVRFAGVEP